MISVAYTDRPELGRCRAMLGPVRFVTLARPFDLGVSIGGSHIYTPAEIARARYGIVNLHFAPLPEFRGRYSAGHALRLGVGTFGATLHYVDEGIDTGPIIDRRLVPVLPDDDVASLRGRAFAAGVALWSEWAPRLVAAAERGERVPAEPQDEGRARYFDRASLALLP